MTKVFQVTTAPVSRAKRQIVEAVMFGKLVMIYYRGKFYRGRPVLRYGGGDVFDLDLSSPRRYWDLSAPMLAGIRFQDVMSVEELTFPSK